MNRYRYYAHSDLISFTPHTNGFWVTVVFEPRLVIEDKLVLEAFGDAPEISGPVVQFVHNLKPERHVTQIRVWCDRPDDILKRAREYEKSS